MPQNCPKLLLPFQKLGFFLLFYFIISLTFQTLGRAPRARGWPSTPGHPRAFGVRCKPPRVLRDRSLTTTLTAPENGEVFIYLFFPPDLGPRGEQQRHGDLRGQGGGTEQPPLPAAKPSQFGAGNGGGGVRGQPGVPQEDGRGWGDGGKRQGKAEIGSPGSVSSGNAALVGFPAPS